MLSLDVLPVAQLLLCPMLVIGSVHETLRPFRPVRAAAGPEGGFE